MMGREYKSNHNWVNKHEIINLKFDTSGFYIYIQ